MVLRTEPESFSMSVDESADGPILITVRGALSARHNVRLFSECLAEMVLAGRSVVIDLMGVRSADETVMNAIADSAKRLSRIGCRLAVACPPSLAPLERFTETARSSIEYVDTPGSAFAGTTMASEASMSASDALRGTYL